MRFTATIGNVSFPYDFTLTNETNTTTGTGRTSYTFTGPTVTGANATAGTAGASAAGTYTVTVGNAAGCHSTTTLVIDQSAGGSGGGTVPTLSASSATICEGGNVTVFASGTASAYQWYQNSIAVSGQTSATLALAGVPVGGAGTYVLISDGGSCGSFTTTAFTLMVNPLPSVVIVFPNSATVVGPKSVFATVTVAYPLDPFTVQASGGVLYEWM